MTLRLRLVIGLALLVTVGLAVFGFTTYSLYSHSEYQRLDDQIRSSATVVTGQLCDSAGTACGPVPGHSGGNPSFGNPGGDGDGGHGGPPVVVPPGTYAELRDKSGKVLSTVQASDSEEQPKLAKNLKASGNEHRFFTTGSATGSGDWRVLVTAADRPTGATLVVAVPTTEITSSLDHLTLIELAVGRWSARAPGARFVVDPAARPAPTGAHGDVRAHDHRRRPVATCEPGRRPHGGRAARSRAEHDAERDRGCVPGARRDRDTAAPVPRRRVARAAHAVHVDPGVRRAVPARRRPGPRPARGHPAPHRGGDGADEDARRGSAAPRPPRRDAPRRTGTGRPRGARGGRLQRCDCRLARPADRARRARARRGAGRPGPPSPGDREPGEQRVAAHTGRQPDRSRRDISPTVSRS